MQQLRVSRDDGLILIAAAVHLAAGAVVVAAEAAEVSADLAEAASVEVVPAGVGNRIRIPHHILNLFSCQLSFNGAKNLNLLRLTLKQYFDLFFLQEIDFLMQ